MLVEGAQANVAPAIGSTDNVVVPTFGQSGVAEITLGVTALFTVTVNGTQVVDPQLPDAFT